MSLITVTIFLLIAMPAFLPDVAFSFLWLMHDIGLNTDHSPDIFKFNAEPGAALYRKLVSLHLPKPIKLNQMQFILFSGPESPEKLNAIFSYKEYLKTVGYTELHNELSPDGHFHCLLIKSVKKVVVYSNSENPTGTKKLIHFIKSHPDVSVVITTCSSREGLSRKMQFKSLKIDRPSNMFSEVLLMSAFSGIQRHGTTGLDQQATLKIAIAIGSSAPFCL